MRKLTSLARPSLVLFSFALLGACSSSANFADEAPTTEASASETTPDAAVEAAEVDAVMPDSTGLEGIGESELLAAGFSFTEGPAWDAENQRLVFSDVPESTIFTVSLDGEVATLAERPSNGIIADSRGGFMVAGMSGQDLVSMSSDGSTTAFVDSYEGISFNQPNDLVELVGSGFYFTDPVFGGGGTSECFGVYFVTYAGEVTQLFCADRDLPNGIALSPDDSILYVAYTGSGNVTQMPIAADGRVGEESLLVKTSGRADGMVVDSEGNLYVAASSGIEVFEADGSGMGTIEFAEQPSNVTIGGPSGSTLFVTARSSVYIVELGKR